MGPLKNLPLKGNVGCSAHGQNTHPHAGSTSYGPEPAWSDSRPTPSFGRHNLWPSRSDPPIYDLGSMVSNLTAPFLLRRRLRS